MSKADSVTFLREVRLEPVDSVVAELEELVERARAGEIRGYALIASCDGGAHSTIYNRGDGSISDLIVANLRLQRRLLDHEED